MDERELLMVPGPTNVSPSVLAAVAKPTQSHVSAAFSDIFKDTLVDLRRIFKTNGFIIPLAGTGTLGSEVALANVIDQGDKVLAVCCGFFSNRLAEVAATLGAQVDKIDVPWGSVTAPEEVEKKLSSADYKALLTTHVETSTGVANPIEKLGKLAKAGNVLYVVDAVASMGGLDVQVDTWGIDVCFTASQKAIAAPPGLAIVSFSPNALKARDQRRSPIRTYYGDVRRWIPIMEDPMKYFATHPVNMIYGLHQACKMILSEGLEERFRRHSRLATAFRAAMRSLGLKILCDEKASASTLSAVHYPDGIRDSEFRRTMATKYGIVIAGGLGSLSQKIFRVGHMGIVNCNDIMSTIAAVEGSLLEQHYKFTAGRGIAAANDVLLH